MKRMSRVGVIVTLVLLVGSLMVFATENPLKGMEPLPRDGEGPLRFAMLTVGTTVQFWVPVRKGFQDAAAMLGVEASHLGPPTSNMAAQADILETAIGGGLDGVAIFVSIPGSMDVGIEKALAAGMPVLIMCTGTTTAEKYNLAYVGQNNKAAGLAWAEKIKDLLGPDPAGKRVCFLTELPGQTCLEERIGAGKEVLEPLGVKCDVVDTTTDRVVAYGAVESYYQAHPDVAGFFAVDTTGSPVAATFIENNDLVGKVVSAGFDLTAEVCKGLENESMAFTVDQHPYAEGFLSMMQLYLWATLGIRPSWVDTGGHIVTPEDASQYNLLELVESGYR